MPYSKTQWVDNSEPALTADRLNKIEQGVADAIQHSESTHFDGDYNSLSNTPTLFDGQYNSLTGLPTLFDGQYNSLTGLPTLFSGSYTDLADKPIDYVVNPEDYNVVFDGVTNSAVELASVAALNQRIIFPYKKTLVLSGSTDILFSSSVDFNSCTLDVSTYTGTIYFGTNNVVINHGPASDAVTQLQTQAEIKGRWWEGWSANTDMVESFISVETNQGYYNYRDATINRRDFNYVTRLGQVLSTPPFPIDTSTITNIKQIKSNKAFTIYENLILDTGDNDDNTAFIKCEDCTWLNLKNITFKSTANNIQNNLNVVGISIHNCYMVRIDGVNASYPWIHNKEVVTYGTPNVYNQSGWEYTYNINFGDVYDIEIKNLVGQGDGWGCMGNGMAQRVKFENCDINRLDFHEPCVEHLFVDKCSIGTWGVQACALGDVLITRSTFSNNDAAHIWPRYFIHSRGDTNGFCNGHLVVRDCQVDVYDVPHLGNTSLQTSGLHFSRCFGDVNQGHPVDSPFEPSYWYSETFENIRFRNVSDNPDLKIQLGVAIGIPAGVRQSELVSIRNCVGPLTHWQSSTTCGDPPSDFDSGYNARRQRPNRVVKITDSQFYWIGNVTGDLNSTHKMKYICDNVYWKDGILGTQIEIWAGGDYTFNQCYLEGFDFVHGTTINQECDIRVNGCRINHTATHFNRPVNAMSKSFVHMNLNNCYIEVQSSAAFIGSQALLTALFNSCILGINGGARYVYYDMPTYIYNVDYITVGINYIKMPSQFTENNEYTVFSEKDGTEVETRFRFPLYLNGVGASVVTPINTTDWLTVVYTGVDAGSEGYSLDAGTRTITKVRLIL